MNWLIKRFLKKEKHVLIPVNYIDKDFVKDFVYKWNLSYPIDRWWRLKHKVSFNSPEHRVKSLLDMKIEWEEDQLFSNLFNNEKYLPNKGEYMKKDIEEDLYLSDAERLENFKKEVSKIDLSQYDD